MINALLGGALIGVAVSVMLMFTGRVTGISGIIGGLLNPQTPDKSWRLLFILGLVVGGGILRFFSSGELFLISTRASTPDYILAGLLVGFGTLLGNGCTSGHGVCGISRFSLRSLIATMTFIFSGAVSVLVFRLIRGEL